MDDSCLVYHYKGVKENKHNLNKSFSNVCDFYVDNKLIIHFGDDKNKKHIVWYKISPQVYKLDIRYSAIHMKQYHSVI